MAGPKGPKPSNNELWGDCRYLQKSSHLSKYSGVSYSNPVSTIPKSIRSPTTITHSRDPIISLMLEFKFDLRVISNEQSPEGLEPQAIDYESFGMKKRSQLREFVKR